MKLHRPSLLNWLCLSGLLAVVFYFMHVYLGTANYPGYDSLAQAVSDLTANDSPVQQLASRFTSLYGSLSCLACVLLCLVVQGRYPRLFRVGIYLYTLMNWVSLVGYGLFPLSGTGNQGQFQDIVHVYVVTASIVLLSIVSLVLIFVGGIKERPTKLVGLVALVALLAMFTGAVGIGVVPKNLFGLMERFSVFSVVLFTGVLGLFGFFSSRSPEFPGARQ